MKSLFRKFSFISFLLALFLAFFVPIKPAAAQIKIPKDKIKIPVKTPQLPDLDRWLQEEPPVSTSLPDVIFDIPFLDDFNPPQATSLMFLPMSPGATIPLLPGIWEADFQSYCLKAGTYAPGGGDGYAYAPLKGKQADIVENILKNSVYHPEINQQDIQLLLWAIIARSKLSECDQNLQKTAKVLITPKEYDRLNGGALGKIPAPVLKAALDKLPPAVREVFDAENRIREMVTSSVSAPYGEVERVAIWVGEVLPPPDSREMPEGRWSYVPDGYFIRFFPYGYATTKTQIYYPENFTIETDDDGLITSIADRRETKIQITYDKNIEPLFWAGDDRVAGLAFKELVLSWAGPTGVTESRTIKNSGWVLAGVPTGDGQPESNSSSRFAGAAERYKWSVAHRNQVLELKDKLATVNPELKTMSAETAWSVIYLGNYCEALKQVMADLAASSGNQEGGLPDNSKTELAGLAYRAWMKGLSLLANGQLGMATADQTQAVFKDQQIRAIAFSPDLLRAMSLKVPADGDDWATPENFSSGESSKDLETGLKALSLTRELPVYKWVKPQAPKWETESKPKKKTSSGLPEFIPNKNVAQPGNTGRQRLGQSGRKAGSDRGKKAAERTRKVIKWFSGGTSAASGAAGKLLGAGTPYGIPKTMATHTIGGTVRLWGECIDLIAIDPSRSDYTILAVPEPGTFQAVQPGDGVTRTRAQAVNSFLSTGVDLMAKLRAARFSVERCSGARQAGDSQWARRQQENALKYERESGLAMIEAADKMEALVRICESEHVPDTRITPELIESYKITVRQEGFAPEELEALRALNITEEEIAEIKAGILEEEVEGPESLYESSLELAQALREFSAELLKLPIL